MRKFMDFENQLSDFKKNRITRDKSGCFFTVNIVSCEYFFRMIIVPIDFTKRNNFAIK